jgi:hypothetical protein
MSIQFDKLPKEKPNQNATINPGRYLVKITKAEIVERKEASSYLRVTFTTKDKETFTENFFDDPKPFLLYKISRLLLATEIVLEGEGSLADMGKLLVGKKAIVDVTVNDKGYANLDFNDKKEGIYKLDEVVIGEVDEDPEEKPVLDKDVTEAIASDDEEF